MLLVSSGVLVVQCHQPLQCFRSGLRPSRFQLFISCRNGAHEQNGQRVIPTRPPLACCHVWGRRKPSNWVKVLCDDNRRANRTRNPPRCQGVVVPAPCQLDGSVHPDKSFFWGDVGERTRDGGREIAFALGSCTCPSVSRRRASQSQG